MLVEQEHRRVDRFRTLDTPVHFSATPGSLRAPAPALGQHTDAVLGEAGLAPAEIGRLRAARVIA